MQQNNWTAYLVSGIGLIELMLRVLQSLLLLYILAMPFYFIISISISISSISISI